MMALAFDVASYVALDVEGFGYERDGRLIWPVHTARRG